MTPESTVAPQTFDVVEVINVVIALANPVSAGPSIVDNATVPVPDVESTEMVAPLANPSNMPSDVTS